ncbi:MAG: hypothetical protein AAF585_00445 [Verrucomicrobiota bacterium]
MAESKVGLDGVVVVEDFGDVAFRGWVDDFADGFACEFGGVALAFAGLERFAVGLDGAAEGVGGFHAVAAIEEAAAGFVDAAVEGFVFAMHDGEDGFDIPIDGAAVDAFAPFGPGEDDEFEDVALAVEGGGDFGGVEGERGLELAFVVDELEFFGVGDAAAAPSIRQLQDGFAVFFFGETGAKVVDGVVAETGSRTVDVAVFV